MKASSLQVAARTSPSVVIFKLVSSRSCFRPEDLLKFGDRRSVHPHSGETYFGWMYRTKASKMQARIADMMSIRMKDLPQETQANVHSHTLCWLEDVLFMLQPLDLPSWDSFYLCRWVFITWPVVIAPLIQACSRSTLLLMCRSDWKRIQST